MNTNIMNQTTKDIAQVVEIIAQREHELGKMTDACPHEMKALDSLKAATQRDLESLRRTA